jgi:hypothetical protein
MPLKKLHKYLILIVSATFLASCVLQLQPEENENIDQQAAKETFSAYKYALLNNLGKDAADLISEKTIQHYAHLRSLALAASIDELNQLSAYNKFVVLNMRHSISGSLLQQMSAKDIFAFGVNQEWISKEDVAPYNIGTISVYGAYASAELLRGTRNTDTFLEFLNEDGVWRINLQPILKKASQDFTAQVAGQNIKNENAMILTIIESISGKKPAESIWIPVIDTRSIVSDQATGGTTENNEKEMTQ